ncbi:MAG: DUF2147 domain-containing protein [Saprospiraceae bacterium]|nr:DUF2147 domain-containing protein [Saprospiraceae bacterium]
MKKICFSLILFLGLSAYVSAQGPVGTWKTVDDQSGEARSYVEIYEEGGKYFGKITNLLEADPGTLCDKCKGDKKNQPILGLVIIENMKSHKDFWKGGSILDPETGNDYGCSIWFDEGNKEVLKVRGKHWSGLYRTQTWYRVKS